MKKKINLLDEFSSQVEKELGQSFLDVLKNSSAMGTEEKQNLLL